jgi:hypothetical protein
VSPTPAKITAPRRDHREQQANTMIKLGYAALDHTRQLLAKARAEM